MTIWEKIKTYYPIALFLLCILGFTLFFTTCSTLKSERAQREFENKLNEQNFKAKNDSITLEYNKKLKMWEFEKASYVLKFDDLEKYNKGLYDTIKKLKGKISILIASAGTIDIGKTTIGNNLVQLNTPNHYGLDFKSTYSDPGLSQILTGQSRFYASQEKVVDGNNTTLKLNIKADSTYIDSNMLKIKVIYGMKEENNKYNVFALSSSPKVIFTDLTGGYFIDKQPPLLPESPKRWSFGPNIAFGLNTDYNLANPRFGWNIGVSLHYAIWQWRMPWEKK